MSLTTRVLVALAVLPTVAFAQSDTTRRTQVEARGETALPAERFGTDRPNYGFTAGQATELQQALTRAGCNVGTPDGVVGRQTLLGIACFRTARNLEAADFETVLTALNVSYAVPPAPPPPQEPPKREPVLPIVLRPDSNYRPDVRARRDSVQRDSVRRDSVRRDSVRRDSTARRDTTRPPSSERLRLFDKR